MKSLTQTYDIHASVETVWQALTDPKIINEWGGGPAIMDGEEGTQFSLWGGDVHGKNTAVHTGKKLVQDWYGGDWGQPSIVEFELEGNDGRTLLTLTHTDIPAEEFDEIEDGWNTYYLGPLKKLLESKKAQ